MPRQLSPVHLLTADLSRICINLPSKSKYSGLTLFLRFSLPNFESLLTGLNVRSVIFVGNFNAC
jgi:hypothetical protein